jgi:CRP-like cAMP-binding protein
MFLATVRRGGAKRCPAEGIGDFLHPVRAGRLCVLSAEWEGKAQRRLEGGKGADGQFAGHGGLFSEKSMSRDETLRSFTAWAITACMAMRIARLKLLRVRHEDHAFSDFFMQFILTRASEPKPISSINSSTQARSAWRGYCS